MSAPRRVLEAARAPTNGLTRLLIGVLLAAALLAAHGEVQAAAQGTVGSLRLATDTAGAFLSSRNAVGPSPADRQLMNVTPVLQFVTLDGKTITLVYDTDLDTASVPAAGDYTVEVAPRLETRTLDSMSPVSISGKEVALTLEQSVASGKTIVLSYTPGTNPVQADVGGADAASLTRQLVANTSDAGDSVLVSNSAKQLSTFEYTFTGNSRPAHMSFTTGPNPLGYVLRTVEVQIDTRASDTSFTMGLYATNSNGLPSTKITDLSPPNSFQRGWRAFTAPDGLVLKPRTTYSLKMYGVGTSSSKTLELETTYQDEEDDRSQTGWRLANGILEQRGGNWEPPTPGPGATETLKVILKGTNPNALNRTADLDLGTTPDVWGISGTFALGDSALMFTVDADDKRVRAYQIADGSEQSSRNFDLTGSNANAKGMWTNGSTMWVADKDDGKVYVYSVSGGVRDTDMEFDLHDDNSDPKGVWSDGRTAWVVGNADTYVYAYDLATGEHRSAWSFDLDAENAAPNGIWSDGVTIWVADGPERQLYAYSATTLASGTAARDSSKDLELDLENGHPVGIWATSTNMFVADSSRDKIHAYALDDANEAPTYLFAAETVAIFEGSGTARNVGLPFSAINADGDAVTYALSGSDASSFTIDTSGQLSTRDTVDYDFETKSTYTLTITATDADGSDSVDVTVELIDIVEFVSATVNGNLLILTYDHELDADSVPDPSAYTVEAAGTEVDVESVVVEGTTVRLTLASDVATGQTVTLSYERPSQDPIVALDGHYPLDLDEEPVTNNTGTATAPQLHRVSLEGAELELTYDSALDTNSVPAASAWVVKFVNALTSDPVEQATTVDGVAISGKVVTLTLSEAALPRESVSVTYTPPVSQPIQSAVGAVDAAAVSDVMALNSVNGDFDFSFRGYDAWSDGTTMWMADFTADTLRAFNLGSGNRDTAKDLSLPINFQYYSHGGLWSDGATVWVASYPAGEVYAFDLADGTRAREHDFSLANSTIGPVWSDGTTLWVARIDFDGIHAYDIGTGTRDRPKDLRLFRDSKPSGIWSDGVTMWFVNRSDRELYAYDLVTGLRDNTRQLKLSSANRFGNGVWSDGTTVWIVNINTQRDESGEVYTYPLRGLARTAVTYVYETMERRVPENSSAGVAVGLPVRAVNPDGDTVTYALSGADVASFAFDTSTGQITTRAGVTLDHEARSRFVVTVTATDAEGSDSVDVVITTLDADDEGSLQLRASPRVGARYPAMLVDPDLPVTAVTWQWARADAATGPFTAISNARADTYKPVAGDDGKWLSVTATYTDKFGAGKTLTATAPHAVTTGNLATNATLAGLTLSDVRLQPAFAGATPEYTATTGYVVDTTTVTPVPSDGNATFEILDASGDAHTDAASTVPGHQVDLAVGETAIQVRVYAEDDSVTRT